MLMISILVDDRVIFVILMLLLIRVSLGHGCHRIPCWVVYRVRITLVLKLVRRVSPFANVVCFDVAVGLLAMTNSLVLRGGPLRSDGTVTVLVECLFGARQRVFIGCK